MPALKFSFYSLKTKMLLTITGVILFFGIIATIVTFTNTFKTLRNEKKQTITDAIALQTTQVENILTSAGDLSRTIARNPNVIETMVNEKVLNATEILNSYNSDDKYSALYLINDAGIVLVSTDESFVNQNYGFRDYFQRAIEGQDFVDISIGITSKQLGYYFSTPIYDKEQIVGVAVVKLIPKYVDEVLKTGENIDKVMLSDSYGVIIHTSEDTRLYNSLGKLSENTLRTITEKKRYADFVINPLSYDILMNELENAKTVKFLEFFDEMDNEQELLAVKQIGNFPFYMITETETESIMEQSLLSASILSLLVLIAAVSATVIIYFIVARFLKPLGIIQEANRRAATGIYTPIEGINTKDELGDLVTTYNDMIKAIKIAKEDIEDKVKERTANLQKLNNLMVGRELKMVELKKEILSLKTEDIENGK